MRIRTYLIILLAWLVSTSSVSSVSAAAAPASSRESDSPNIVVIMTDDQDVTMGSLAYMPRLQQLWCSRA